MEQRVLFVGVVHAGTAQVGPHVVHQKVEDGIRASFALGEALVDRVQERPPALRGGNVGLHGGEPWLRGQQLLQRQQVARTGDDIAALRQELVDNGAAEPLAAACHDGPPALQAPQVARGRRRCPDDEGREQCSPHLQLIA